MLKSNLPLGPGLFLLISLGDNGEVDDTERDFIPATEVAAVRGGFLIFGTIFWADEEAVMKALITFVASCLHPSVSSVGLQYKVEGSTFFSAFFVHHIFSVTVG